MVWSLVRVFAMGDAWQVGWDRAAEDFGAGFEAQVGAAGVGNSYASACTVSVCAQVFRRNLVARN
jgi:hypothetical protein